MFKKTLILSLCLLLNTFSPLLAQQYKFDQLNIDDGLSQSFIYSIEQDYRGFLWFATRDGLNRYDGYGFKIYNYHPDDSLSLSNNVVTSLHEDVEQRLWIGAGALNLYNRQKDCIERIISAEELGLDQASVSIQIIETDHHGNVWIAINDIGLYRIELNENSSKIQHQVFGPYRIKANYTYDFDNDSFYDILAVGNNLWVSHRQGLFILTADENGKIATPENADFQQINFDFEDEYLLTKALFLDQNTLWISTNYGLIRLNDPEEVQHYQLYALPHDLISDPVVALAKDIDIDDEGRLWMTSFGGVLIFDPSDASYQLVTNEPKVSKSLSLNNTTELVVDNSGIVWIGSGGLGINKYNQQQNRFSHYLGKDVTERLYSVYNLIEDDQGSIWFVDSNNKLGYFNPETNALDIIALSEENAWYISDMTKSSDGQIWLANENELINFDPLSRAHSSYLIEKHIKGSQDGGNYVLHYDFEDQLWLCNAHQLLTFDPQTEKFTAFPLPTINVSQVNTLYRDEEGFFWIGSNQGLMRYDIINHHDHFFRANPLFQDSLNHPNVKAVLPDPTHQKQFLWISTGGGGISKFDKTRFSFSAFTQEDGLPNNFVYGILPDDQGKFWISTNKGLSCFDPKNNTFENFTENDGLQSNEFNSRSFYKNENGELYFGGINGITKFTPESIIPNTHIPPMVISELWLLYKAVSPDTENSPLTYAVSETENLYLNHGQNNISFKFAALDFTAPEKNQYLYKLEGFNEEWVKASADRRASYTNLAPGEYVFHVIGSNNDGVWNYEGKRMTIIIAPPLWRSWWAYALYFLTASGILYVMYRYQRDRIRMHEEIKRKAFQNEKLAELDQYKSRFFANISHEFRTPITLIMGRVDELEGAISNDKRSKLHSILDSIKVNAYQVVGLIDQLLDISRLEDNKLKMNRRSGDLVLFLKILCASLHSSAENKGVYLNFQSGQPFLFISTDWEIMQKIYQNLIVNAIKFTPSGGSVTVSLENYVWSTQQEKNQTGQNWLRVQVRDTGIGISDEQLPYIFDRFYQSDQDFHASEKGFGLGLAMVKELISLLGGKIEVESKRKKGSVFTVHLPFDLPDEDSLEFNEKEFMDKYLLDSAKSALKNHHHFSPGEVLASDKESRGNILIVEDNDELRNYIKDIFSDVFEVWLAENAKEGWEIATTEIPDLIITDLMMPGKNGLELSEDLKSDQRTSHIPIIVLTARADLESRLDSLEAGVDDFLVKPFHTEELRKKVNNLINVRQILRVKYAQMLTSTDLNHDEPLTIEEIFLKKLHEIIQQNLQDENYGVENIAAELNMSASHLYRKVKALTGLSTVQLIQSYRLEQAKIYLLQGYNVSEVTYKVGFTSPAYFSQLFKKYTGLMPKHYGKKKVRPL